MFTGQSQRLYDADILAYRSKDINQE